MLWSGDSPLRRSSKCSEACRYSSSAAGGGRRLALTALLVMLLARLSPWLAGLAEVWLISTTIASKGLKDAGMAVYTELRSGDIPAARRRWG